MAARLHAARPRVAVLDTRRLKPQAKQADPFYLTPEWKRLIAEIIAERGRVCEDPACRAHHQPGMRVFGDHVIELRDGGAPLDKANVMLRCGSSHTAKTLRERARRMGAINTVGGGG